MNLKNKLVASLVLALSLLVVSTNEASAEQSGASNQLTFANFRDIRDLNPHFYAGELYAQNLIFESLVKLNKDGSFSPWLSKSWKISEDGKKYIFNLREDVEFFDGEKFDAKTAKANLDAILDNHKKHGWLPSIRLMMKVKNSGKDPIEVLGKYKLSISLSDSYYPFLTELAVIRPFRFISPKSFKNGTTKNGVNSLNGTGAYMLKSNKIDEYAIFVRNEKYWGSKPQIKNIKVKVIPDNQTRHLALQNGELDMIFGSNMVDAEAFNRFKNTPGFNVSMSKPIATRMMLLNTTSEILKDVKVRKAILHATDKVKISLGLFEGIEKPADTLLASNVPYANIGLKPYEFSFEKARALLDEAGWKKIAGKKYRQKDGKELEIILNYSSSKVPHKNIAQFLQGEYSKIGMKIKAFGEEEQAYMDRIISGKFDFTFNLSWGLPYDPQSFLGAMVKPGINGDYPGQLGLSNKKELDKHILAALKSVDKKKRQEHYKYVLETFHKQAVYLPLTYETNRAIFSNKVQNVDFDISMYEIPVEKMKIKN